MVAATCALTLGITEAKPSPTSTLDVIASSCELIRISVHAW